jgi:hypothetical protein
LREEQETQLGELWKVIPLSVGGKSYRIRISQKTSQKRGRGDTFRLRDWPM